MTKNSVVIKFFALDDHHTIRVLISFKDQISTIKVVLDVL